VVWASCRAWNILMFALVEESSALKRRRENRVMDIFPTLLSTTRREKGRQWPFRMTTLEFMHPRHTLDQDQKGQQHIPPSHSNSLTPTSR
jgi:hypothetical protein